MATNVATGLEIEGDNHIRPVEWAEWVTLPVREQDNAVRTVRGAIRVPAVIVAVNYARVPKKRPKLSARNIRERDLRTGWGYPIRLSLGGMASFALHAPWLLGQLRYGRLSMPNIAAQCGSNSLVKQSVFITQQLDASVSWRDVREMIQLWGGPFAIKGILSADDARRAADIGATAVIVSNHGGRQLDGSAASIEVLPEIARAVGDRIDVILDSGVRRGVHVLKALALGAKACSVGRAYLYGLAAGGEPGVKKALDILRTELIRAMQLSGCTDVASVDSTLVRRF